MEHVDHLMEFIKILEQAAGRGASDIHIAPGTHILLRIDGKLVPLPETVIKPYETEQLLQSMLTEKQRQELDESGDLDFAYSIPGKRMRVNVFRQRGTYAMSVRLLSFSVPKPEQLGIPEAVMRLTEKKRGLVLVTGAAGSGKSTTLASMIDFIAARDEKTIITLENPIEYLYTHNRSMVLQREIGLDSKSYVSGLTAALREDPDIILVGEMTDFETAALVLTAAETGHLVFSAMHTNSVLSSIERMIEIFPPYKQQQVRIQLAGVLQGVVSQQLLPKQNESGRVAAFEVLIADENVRSLIREQKNHQLPSVIHSGRNEGMQTMDDAIYDLYMKSCIDSETAVSYAQDAPDMSRKVRLF